MSHTITHDTTIKKNNQSDKFKLAFINEVSDLNDNVNSFDLPKVSFAPRQKVLDAILAYSQKK